MSERVSKGGGGGGGVATVPQVSPPHFKGSAGLCRTHLDPRTGSVVVGIGISLHVCGDTHQEFPRRLMNQFHDTMSDLCFDISSVGRTVGPSVCMDQGLIRLVAWMCVTE